MKMTLLGQLRLLLPKENCNTIARQAVVHLMLSFVSTSQMIGTIAVMHYSIRIQLQAAEHNNIAMLHLQTHCQLVDDSEDVHVIYNRFKCWFPYSYSRRAKVFLQQDIDCQVESITGNRSLP